jgi:DNA adenine methylase
MGKKTTPFHIPKPILKWVGGKTQIVDKLIMEFPKEINNYREIFLGGGSVLIAFLTCIKNGLIELQGNVYAYDVNEPLIYLYKNIQNHPTELYNEIQNIIIEFNACSNGKINRSPSTIEEAQQAHENYYYWVRMQYNKLTAPEKKTIKGSSMFVFLNKTCFRGVFRVGPHGFNVPYGHYTNPEIINLEHLHEIHQLIQGVIFECCDFNISLRQVEPGDYVYLDPPYAPAAETSFVGYTKNGFHTDQHNQLFQCIHGLTYAKIMLSNADVAMVRDAFTGPQLRYTIIPIVCKRAIHSKTPDATAKELIIKNY